jgi:hypothetical protein
LEINGDDIIDRSPCSCRLRDALPGDSLLYDVWTGEVRYRVRLDVKDCEPIDVPAGHFTALKVVPELWRIEGQPAPDTRLRRATIWVSNDPDHTLLRIRSEIFVGAVTLDLWAPVDADSDALARNRCRRCAPCWSDEDAGDSVYGGGALMARCPQCHLNGWWKRR